MQIARSLRLASILAPLCLIAPLLTGCGAISGFIADSLPVWAGGLPAEVPPRPSDPRYPEYERAQQAKAAAAKTEPAKPEAAK